MHWFLAAVQALDQYSAAARQYSDLALANYASVGRALLLYQTGQKMLGILEMEGLEYSLRGYAEVRLFAAVPG